MNYLKKYWPFMLLAGGLFLLRKSNKPKAKNKEEEPAKAEIQPATRPVTKIQTGGGSPVVDDPNDMFI